MDLLASKAGPLICLYCVVFQLYNVTNGDRPCAMNMCLWEHHVQRVKVTLLTQTFFISFSHELLTQRGDGLASQPWFNMENVMLMYYPIIIMWRSSSPHCLPPHTQSGLWRPPDRVWCWWSCHRQRCHLLFQSGCCECRGHRHTVSQSAIPRRKLVSLAMFSGTL